MDATYLSLFIFLITTALYYFYKPNPDVGLLDGNDKDQSTFVKSGYVYLIIYVGFVILTQFFINVGILINKCGGNVSENFSAGALMTFIPWVFIFGSIVVILIAFPGFKSAFSNVIGYFVVAGRANTILAELLVDTDIDKEIDKIEDLDKKSEFKKAAQAVVKIFGDISVIINQMVPENFKEYWKLLTPLMRARVVANTGPRTPAAFITAVSIAYALRSRCSGRIAFHRGRTERLIGGEVTPSKNE